MVVVDLLWRRRCKAKGAATSTGGGAAAIVTVLHSRQRDVLMIDVTFFVFGFLLL